MKMISEHMKVYIENALNLIDIISDDLEANFIGTHVDGSVKARATMTVSALSILSSYLRQVCKEVSA